MNPKALELLDELERWLNAAQDALAEDPPWNDAQTPIAEAQRLVDEIKRLDSSSDS